MTLEEDLSILIDHCGNGRLSGLELALRHEIAQALNLALLTVRVESVQAIQFGRTEVSA